MTPGKGRSTPENCLLAHFSEHARPTPRPETDAPKLRLDLPFLVHGPVPVPRGAKGQAQGQASRAARVAPLGRQTYGAGPLAARNDHVPGQPPERRFNGTELQDVGSLPPEALLAPRLAPAPASGMMTAELGCETERSRWGVSSSATAPPRAHVTRRSNVRSFSGTGGLPPHKNKNKALSRFAPRSQSTKAVLWKTSLLARGPPLLFTHARTVYIPDLSTDVLGGVIHRTRGAES